MNISEPVRVAYIPLDDRPVCKDRVEYLAKSIGFELWMPETHLYRTALDNMEPNPGGRTLGDRHALLEWLRSIEDKCEYYIISLDQILSGGLVGSRYLSETDLSFEVEAMETIVRICKKHTVMMFDTVVRLASTVSYQGYDLESYHLFRAYGQVPRKILSDEELTIENIVSGYRFDDNGNEIQTKLSEERISKYHAVRERKLRLSAYILEHAGEDANFLYLGVDDSNPQNTIQTNEIAYLAKRMGKHCVISAAADELGLCCLARIATLVYRSAPIRIRYFGPGKDLPADEFDFESLSENVRKHLLCLNAVESDCDNCLEALILTREADQADRSSMIEAMKMNANKCIPTVLVDASTKVGLLGKMIFDDPEVSIGEVFGYSGWNTVANAMGIAFSQGIARYAYLLSVTSSTNDADEGFLRSLAFDYIKDISYKQFHPNINGIEEETYPCSVPLVLRRLNQSRIIHSLNPVTRMDHKEVAASGYYYPMNRRFEMNCHFEIVET